MKQILPGPSAMHFNITDSTQVDLKEILETIPDAIIVIDDQGIIQLFNLAAEPLFRYSSEEVTGLHLGLLLPELELRSRIIPNCTELLTAIAQDGQKIPIEFSAGEINLGKRRLLVCVIRDISDRLRAEAAAAAAQKQLIQAEKLASLGELVAGVAHEINTPLGISVTAASHLQEQYQKVHQAYLDNQLQRQALENFFQICEQSASILNNNLQRASELIRSFKQVAVDQSSNALRRIDMKTYLEELLLSLRPKLKNNPVSVQLHCPEDMQITTCPGAISQVLTNLIVNSLVHGFDGAQDGIIDIDVSRSNKQVQILYRDNGRGMSEDILKQAFDPFFTTRRSSGSSGLGLHITHNLVVQSLGGKLEVSSRPAEGVLFTILFPEILEEQA